MEFVKVSEHQIQPVEKVISQNQVLTTVKHNPIPQPQVINHIEPEDIDDVIETDQLQTIQVENIRPILRNSSNLFMRNTGQSHHQFATRPISAAGNRRGVTSNTNPISYAKQPVKSSHAATIEPNDIDEVDDIDYISPKRTQLAPYNPKLVRPKTTRVGGMQRSNSIKSNIRY